MIVPEAIRKGMEQAKKSMTKIEIQKGTIPYEVIGKFGAREGAAETCV